MLKMFNIMMLKNLKEAMEHTASKTQGNMKKESRKNMKRNVTTINLVSKTKTSLEGLTSRVKLMKTE